MVNWLIEASLRNRFLVLGLFVLVGAWGYWALLTTPIDAIPDLSDNQVIVFTDWTGRSPQEVEDQITYPLTVSLQGLPGVRVVRSSSAFGFSMINVIFEDNVDLYFARSRVLERLQLLSKSLPSGTVPTLGPDATGLGHVFWYTVEGKGQSLRDLRSLQDWIIRYQLNAVPGVADAASIGGRAPGGVRRKGHGRGGRVCHRGARRRQHCGRDHPREGKDAGAPGRSACGRQDRPVLRPIVAHRPRGAHAPAGADRGDGRRHDHQHHFSSTFSLRADRDNPAAPRRADGISLHAVPRYQLEHHVTRGHRARDRGPG